MDPLYFDDQSHPAELMVGGPPLIGAYHWIGDKRFEGLYWGRGPGNPCKHRYAPWGFVRLQCRLNQQATGEGTEVVLQSKYRTYIDASWAFNDQIPYHEDIRPFDRIGGVCEETSESKGSGTVPHRQHCHPAFAFLR